jgi:hypothetical protein
MKENHLGLYVIGVIVIFVALPAMVVALVYGSVAEKIMIAVIGLGSSAVTGIVALMRMTGGSGVDTETPAQNDTARLN